MATEADGREPSVTATDVVAFCMGYGAFLALYPVGTVGAVWCASFGVSGSVVPLARCLYFLVLVLTMLVWYASGGGDLLHRRAANAASFVGQGVALAVLPALGDAGAAGAGIMLCCALLGMASATPLLGWYEALLRIHRCRGKVTGFAALAGGSLVAGALAPAGLLVVRGAGAALAGLLGLVALSAVGHALLARRCPRQTEARRPAAGARGRGRYRPSRYVRFTYLTFGMSWALSYSLLLLAPPGDDVRSALVAASTAAGVAVSVALLVLCATVFRAGHDRFGLVMRCTVVAAGSLWACMAALGAWVPQARQLACVAVCLLLMVCAIFMNMELCRGYGLSASDVTASHFVWLFAGIAAGTAFYAPAVALAGELGVLWVESLGTVSLFVTVLILPSVSSRATDIARSRLPETESLEQRLEVNRHALAVRCGLTSREEQVLLLVTQGCSRKEIASRLEVSPNTVKNHLTSIYAKTGVHSIRELGALVMARGQRPGGGAGEDA